MITIDKTADRFKGVGGERVVNVYESLVREVINKFLRTCHICHNQPSLIRQQEEQIPPKYSHETPHQIRPLVVDSITIMVYYGLAT
jgi:hypothetical protein